MTQIRLRLRWKYSITDLVGPLGKPTHIENIGTVLAAGGGVGVAPLLPIVEAFKKAIRKDVEEHKRDGRKLAVWRNGKVMHVSANKAK